MQRKKGKMMNKYNVTGDEIVALLGKSESDDKILDLFEKLEIDRSEIDRSEIESFDIIDEDEGLFLTFNSTFSKQSMQNEYIGGQYLTGISFEYNFEPLPYTLKDDYSLKEIINTLGREPNYIDIDDPSSLHWFYEDLGWLSIEFEDETLSSIYTMGISLYENPLDKWESTKDEEGVSEGDSFSEIIKPYKR